ncbi:TonB-dependent receptor [Massilia sp. G4R7]|uniref:TonB-dependent receptor n=1 Tax=Massilia phyllostachyos TaxID=2898585 RepID=A0ABS8QB64_9BURK|nr:TonB-dependent receptor [Massilia phyllostachyos]MCD2519002.1 TonB-dependent receptor [Massilia phyllostachyos]
MTHAARQAPQGPVQFTPSTRCAPTLYTQPKHLSLAVSLALAALVAHNAAHAQAQETTPQTPAEELAAADAKVTQVKVVATRASQQSSIERKKNAATAIDSIVAEDVGSLPDRNVGEAISRMSGIALDRGDFGEGVSVAVRGNGPDLTRVELDGQGVQSAGGTDQAGGGSGRGTEFRQLSADLIKSVDVVKGSTADMTEGSLGGGIRIQTRSGLDFKKPFASLRLGASQSSLNKKWEPDANLILSDKFMNGRLGLLANASSTTLANEAHSVQPSNAGRAGYYRLADFDNSPEKTFTFNPSTVNQADSNTRQPMLASPLAAGGVFNSNTPLDIITRSAAAKTKADCYAAFPVLTAAETAPIASSSRGAAQAQRINELTTCLNQWNDYTPSNIRSFVKREEDKRQNLDLRADFKVTDNFIVYAKGSYNRRYNDMHQLTYTLGNVKVNPTGANAVYSPTYNGPAFVDNLTAGTRVPAPGSGYYLYNSPSMASNTYLNGAVANIVPGSIVSDASHHLTSFTISDAGAVTDQTREYAKTISKYLQLGGSYKNGGLSAEFFAGLAKSDFEREQKRMSFTNYYGPVTMSVLPNGLWGYEAPSGSNFDQSNPNQYTQAYPGAATGAVRTSATNTRPAPAYTAAQQPLLTQQSSTYYNPRLMDSEERTAKLDLTYRTPDLVPFFTRIKSGANLRDNIRHSWDPNSGNSGGFTVKDAIGAFGTPGYVPAVVLPTPIIRSTFNGCQDTPGSLGVGGNACQFGFLPGADPRHGLNGNTTLTLAQYQALLNQVLTGQATRTGFFSGAKDRPDALLQNWTELDVNKIFEIVGTPNTNFNCVKECVASDGKVYQQPYQYLKERTTAFYLMGDFKLDHVPFTDRSLPFGWELEGNVGYRYVRNKVSGTGMMTLSSVAIIPGVYDPLRPSAPGGVIESAVSMPVAINETSTDHLPSLNLALWMVPDQFVTRYSGAKTVARPPINYLLPSGNCKYDETLADRDPNATQRCSGTIGNPALQAQTNFNQNLSFEWYPNKDTMFSIAAFKQDGKIGPAISQGVTSLPLAGGGSLVDPVTGVALGDIDFDYSVWQNGAATKRKGLEFGTKTAFTFLPWFLRYTGFDANYTKLRSATSSENVVDLLTGTPLPVARESAYSYNAALWYDDGRLSARVALQAVASYFNCLAGCGSQDANNYPAAGVTSGMVRFPYNPGSPNFKDATRFIDAKISYRWKPNIEFFLEGRNLGNATTSSSQQNYAAFSDGTPNLLDYAYSGRRIMVGVNFRTL